MPVKLRLQRRGRKKQPFYHIVAADARAPRDGKFIEKIGTYNPMTKPASIDLDRDLAYDWLIKGAQPTDTVRAILRFKGVLYKKHLQRGVLKGAITQEAADAKLQEWIEAKESKVAARREQTAGERADFLKQMSGVAPPPPKKVEEAEEARPEKGPKLTLAEEAEAKAKAEEATAAEEAPAKEKPKTEEAAPKVEAKEEETPVAEAKAEEAPAAKEAPKAEEATPKAEAKEEETPVAEAKAEETPATEEPAAEAVEEVVAEEAPAEEKK